MTSQLSQAVVHAIWRLIGSTLSALTVIASLSAAHARDLCADIDDLIEQSGSQFVDVAAQANEDTGDLEATRVLADATYCRVTASSQNRTYYCAWAYPYRAEIATEAFDQLARDIVACFDSRATVLKDQGVNHPDSYDVHRFQTAQADVSVSIKDKVALDATYVFIRVQGRSAD